jgi:hypothetical protein
LLIGSKNFSSLPKSVKCTACGNIQKLLYFTKKSDRR